MSISDYQYLIKAINKSFIVPEGLGDFIFNYLSKNSSEFDLETISGSILALIQYKDQPIIKEKK